jgi:hypothetical protein
MSIREIAGIVKRCPSVVHKVMKHAKKFGPSNKRGSKKKLDERVQRRIVKCVSTQGMSAAAVHGKLQLGCTVRTVQRVIENVQWLSYTKISAKPALKPNHIAARIKWTGEMALKSDQWDRVVFSDEKKWNLDGPDGMRYQWVDSRTPEKVNKRRHSGGGSVMIWGLFSASGKSEIKFLDGRQRSRSTYRP